jgi:thioredoxin reductase (NADPH)
VLDARAIGGQTGASSRIENYLGFPTGISDQALAGRAFNQAMKFGAELAIPVTVERLECGEAALTLYCERSQPGRAGGGDRFGRTIPQAGRAEPLDL